MGVVKELRGRVDAARRVFKEYLQATQDYVDLYRPYPSTTEISGVVLPTSLRARGNLVWAYIQGILPGLLYQPPYAFVDPRQAHHRHRAEVLEMVLNYDIERVKWLRKARAMTVDALLRGWAVSKTGFELDESFRTYPSEFPESEIIEGHVSFMHVPCEEIVWEPGVSLEDARWVCHYYAESIEAVKDNPLYTNTRNLKPTRVGGRVRTDEVEPSALKFDDSEPDYVLLYEIWIRRLGKLRRTRIVLAEGHDQMLLRDDWPMDFWPFDILVFHEDPAGEMPGLSDVAPWATIQQAANVYLTKLISHIARSSTKFVFDDSVPDEQVRTFMKSGDMSAIKVDGHGQPVKDLVNVIDISPASPDLWNGIKYLEQLFSEVSGWTPQMPSQIETATEASIFQAQSTSRTDDRRINGVAFWADQVLNKMLKIIQKFYDDGSVPYLDTDGRRRFVEFTRDDLDADVTLRVEFGHTSRESEARRAQNYLQMMNLLSPYLMQAGGIPEPLREFLRRVMNDVLHWPDAEKLLPPVSPISNPAMENAEMALGNPVVVLPGHEHALHIPVHQNFVNTLDPEEDADVIAIEMEHIKQHQMYYQQTQLSTATVQERSGGNLGGRPPSPEQMVGTEVPQQQE